MYVDAAFLLMIIIIITVFIVTDRVAWSVGLSVGLSH